MEKGGKQSATSDRKIQSEAAAAESDEESLEDNDDGKKKINAVAGDAGAGGAGGSKRSSSSGGRGNAGARICQADKCTADLTTAKQYHRRHKVCEYHAKAAAVIVGSVRQRFCQQCSRFQELEEFDEAKRSCRRRLAGHNERRRKSCFGESQTSTGGPHQTIYGQVGDRRQIHTTIPQKSAADYKHFHIT